LKALRTYLAISTSNTDKVKSLSKLSSLLRNYPILLLNLNLLVLGRQKPLKDVCSRMMRSSRFATTTHYLGKKCTTSGLSSLPCARCPSSTTRLRTPKSLLKRISSLELLTTKSPATRHSTLLEKLTRTSLQLEAPSKQGKMASLKLRASVFNTSLTTLTSCLAVCLRST
jgi:hypothetical protein